MSRKSRERTVEELADKIINFGRNMASYAIMEMVYVAAQMKVDDKRLEPKPYVTFADRQAWFNWGAQKVNEYAGARRLLAGTVRHFFYSTFGEDENGDPDWRKSYEIADILLKHAANNPRETDKPVDRDPALPYCEDDGVVLEASEDITGKFVICHVCGWSWKVPKEFSLEKWEAARAAQNSADNT